MRYKPVIKERGMKNTLLTAFLSFIYFIASTQAALCSEEVKLFTFSEASKVVADESVLGLAKNATIAAVNVFSLYESNLEKYIISNLETSLFKTGKIKLISRNKIDIVLTEQKFGSSGIVNDKSASKIGQLLGAKYILTGELIKPNNKFILSIQILEAETASLAYSNLFEISPKELKGYKKIIQK